MIIESQGGSSNTRYSRWITPIIIIVFLMIWEFLAHEEMISYLFFPAPSRIWATFLEIIQDGTFLFNLGTTLYRVFAGFLLGGIAGVLLGLVMGWSSQIRSALDPLVAMLHPIPKISILPIILIIFGFGENSRVLLVAISVFFQMLITSMSGVLQIKPTYYEVAQNYGAKKLDVFKHVVLPGSMPAILTGARLGLNLALVITITVELRFANEGLGTLMWLSWQTLEIEILYVVVIALSFLGYTFNTSLVKLKSLIIPWI